MGNVNHVRRSRNLVVSEVFDSIQGEGLNMGLPATFIRLAGCNLKCPWCDEGDKPGEERSIDELCELIRSPKVVITGGEPTLQASQLLDLVTELALRETPDIAQIMLETNCTADPDYLYALRQAGNGKLWITGSPKEATLVNWPKDKYLYSEIKLVVDRDFTIDMIPEELFRYYRGRVWLQPEASQMDAMLKKCYGISQRLKSYGFRCGVQLHKVIGVK